MRIGSHINLCGKRQCITAIDALNGLLGIDAYKTDENGVKYPIGYKVEDVEPISITPELLKELGFRKEDGFMRLWSKGDNGHFSYIEFSAIRDKWRLYPSATDGSQTVVRYLHEAELFLGLHNVELIKE